MGVVQLVERRIWDAEDFPGSSPGTHTKKNNSSIEFFPTIFIFLYIKVIIMLLCLNVNFAEKNLKNIKV